VVVNIYKYAHISGTAPNPGPIVNLSEIEQSAAQLQRFKGWKMWACPPCWI